jgi:DNA-binding transcriptional MerR regulator
MKYLRTSDLARDVGIHPNTVRRYVDRGLLPPVTRSPSGYRRFTQRHLDCLRLVRLVYNDEYPGRTIRASGSRMVQAAVKDDWGGALELAYLHLALIKSEQAQADVAATLLERWAQGTPVETQDIASVVGRQDIASVVGRQDAASVVGTQNVVLQIGQVANLLGVTVDMLRNWERNGLIKVPRDPHNGYRRYGATEISRLRVIRMLSRSGYSLMAILRMLLQLDQGTATDLRQALDTPRPDEDVYSASDHWISTLQRQEELAHQAILLIEKILAR